MQKAVVLLASCFFMSVVFSQEYTLHLRPEDRSTDILTLIRRLHPFQLKDNAIFFNGEVNSFNFPQGALIIIDGVKTSDEVSKLYAVPVSEIESITVLTRPADYAIYTSLNVSGVIIVKTRRGEEKNKR